MIDMYDNSEFSPLLSSRDLYHETRDTRDMIVQGTGAANIHDPAARLWWPRSAI